MEFNLKEFSVQIFNFLIIFFLLRKFLWKRFLGVLDDRREIIAKEFKTIEEKKSEISHLQNEYQKKLNQIEEISRQHLQKAVKEGQRIAEELSQQARTEAERIIHSAQEEIQYEVKKAKEELKETVVDLTMRATEGLILEKMNPQTDKKIVEGLLKEMERLK